MATTLKQCLYCGANFKPYRKVDKFCSPQCRYKHYDEADPRKIKLLSGFAEWIEKNKLFIAQKGLVTYTQMAEHFLKNHKQKAAK